MVDGGVRFRTLVSSQGCGERMRVELFDGGAIKVRSKSALPLAWFDWGKNESNVQSFLEWMDEYFELKAWAGGMVSPGLPG